MRGVLSSPHRALCQSVPTGHSTFYRHPRIGLRLTHLPREQGRFLVMRLVGSNRASTTKVFSLSIISANPATEGYGVERFISNLANAPTRPALSIYDWALYAVLRMRQPIAVY